MIRAASEVPASTLISGFRGLLCQPQYFVSMVHLRRMWLVSRERLPFGHPVPSILGLAYALIVKTIFSSLSRLSRLFHWISLDSFPILLVVPHLWHWQCISFYVLHRTLRDNANFQLAPHLSHLKHDVLSLELCALRQTWVLFTLSSCDVQYNECIHCIERKGKRSDAVVWQTPLNDRQCI